jgi:hypothetical protein
MFRKMFDGAKTGSRAIGLFNEINRTIQKNQSLFPMQELITQRNEQFKHWVIEPNTCPGNNRPEVQREDFKKSKALDALNKLPAGYTDDGRKLYGPYYHSTKSLSMLDSICKGEVLTAGQAKYGERVFAYLVTSDAELTAKLGSTTPGVLFLTEKPLEIHQGSTEATSEFGEKQIKINIVGSWDTKEWRNHGLDVNQAQENSASAPTPFAK